MSPVNVQISISSTVRQTANARQFFVDLTLESNTLDAARLRRPATRPQELTAQLRILPPSGVVRLPAWDGS